jgi:hypothetical protein
MARRPMTEAQKRLNAEAQARWREQHIGDGKERLSLVLDASTKALLLRLVDHYGERSITALIERWTLEAASKITTKSRKTVRD